LPLSKEREACTALSASIGLGIVVDMAVAAGPLRVQLATLKDVTSRRMGKTSIRHGYRVLCGGRSRFLSMVMGPMFSLSVRKVKTGSGETGSLGGRLRLNLASGSFLYGGGAGAPQVTCTVPTSPVTVPVPLVI
jgi:hypothetical protein